MRKRLFTIILTATLGVAPLFGQEARAPRLDRMSNAEVATFLHDLAHDIPNWQTRVNQYRQKLDKGYQYDLAISSLLDLQGEELAELQREVEDLQRSETLAGDVSLSQGLEALTQELFQIEGELNNPIDEYASPGLKQNARVWLQAVKDVRREVSRYSLRFFRHTLAAAHESDVAIAHGCAPGRQRKP